MSARILPREEWHRLESEVSDLFRTLNPEDVRVVVVEDGDEIVGHLGVARVVHLEGWWVAPEKARNPGITRALLRAAAEQAEDWAPNWVLATVNDEQLCALMERLGTFIPVHTYMLALRRIAMEETWQRLHT